MNEPDIRAVFPALEQKVYGKPLVYLDNAATAQKPEKVIALLDEMNSGVNGNIHRAVHFLSVQCTERYEQARRVIKKYINAAHEHEIIFTSGTTASVNLLAYSFGQRYIRKGDRIVVTTQEHHSNIVPWQLLCERTGAVLEVWDIDDSGVLDPKKLEVILDKSGPAPKLLAMAHISNVLGLVNPVRDIIRIAHHYKVPVMIDGAQGIVHKRVDVQDLDADFYVFSGHKLYGPTGTGVLYGKEKYLEEMGPWQGGGDMIASVSLTNGTKYAPLPMKFEAGTANFIGAAALGAAVEFMDSMDELWLKEHEETLVSETVKKLSEIEGLTIYGTAGTYYGLSWEKIPLFSFSVEGAHPNDMALLLDKMGIAVRSGQLCAEPLVERLGQTALLRISFGVYNTLEELDYFAACLRKAVAMLR